MIYLNLFIAHCFCLCFFIINYPLPFSGVSMSYSPIGISKWDLDTPALLVDLDIMENNIRLMADRCKSNGLEWRPHSKGHKTPAIAHKQLQAGALGITCAKLGEAEIMAASGIRDILVANQVVGQQKVARLAHLQRQAKVMVAVDDPFHIQSLSDAAQKANTTIPILVEVNIGMDRCGVQPGKPALDLAQQADAAPGVIFAGIMGYEGHAMALPDPEKEKACREAIAHLADTRALIEREGLKVDIVSAGGTGTLAYTPDLSGTTEIQAGGGIFMDTYYTNDLNVKDLSQALTILTTILSHRAPHRAVADAGRKTTSSQFSMPEAKDRAGITVAGLSAEHALLNLDNPSPAIKVGDKLELISGYSDMTVFLHDRIYGIRNDHVEVVWDILGRDKKQ
jgi:D-serine deaminase-like pyridoxal phosphate-dependent protein